MNSVFPEIHTLATFDPFRFAIELPHYSMSALLDSMAFRGSYKPSTVLTHELCHWSDVVGTVWGQMYLEDLFSAYDACVGQDVEPENYPALIKLFDNQRRLFFPEYYKWLAPSATSASINEPWRIEITCGVFFDAMGMPNESDPIYFANFRHHHTDTKQIRQPLTVGSLLELRAIQAEISALRLRMAATPHDESKVDEGIFNREFNLAMYDAKLTTYTAGAHVLANALGVSNPAEAYMLGNAISDISLNANDSNFLETTHPAEFQAFSQQRLDGFLAKRDRGYLFANICAHVGSSLSWKTRKSASQKASIATVQHDLAEGIAKSGLGSYKSVMSEARKTLASFAQHDHHKIRHPALRAVRTKLAKAGVSIFDARIRMGGQLPAQIHQLEQLPTPLIVTSDVSTALWGPNSIEEADWWNLSDIKDRTDRFTRNVLRACRGLETSSTDYTY